MSFTTRVSGSSPAVAPRSHPLQKKSLARENRAAVAASTLRSNPSTDVAPRSGELTLRELPCDVSREVLNSMVYWGGPKAATALRTAGRFTRDVLPHSKDQLVQWARRIAQPSDALRILGTRTADRQGDLNGVLTIWNLPPAMRAEPLAALAETLGERAPAKPGEVMGQIRWPLMARAAERLAVEMAYNSVPQASTTAATASAMSKMTLPKTQEVIAGLSLKAQIAIAEGQVNPDHMGADDYKSYMDYKSSSENNNATTLYATALNALSDPEDWADIQREHLPHIISHALKARYTPPTVNAPGANYIQAHTQLATEIADFYGARGVDDFADIEAFRGLDDSEVNAALLQCSSDEIQALATKYGVIADEYSNLSPIERDLKKIYYLPHKTLLPPAVDTE
jgi:hypothetical protein